MAVLEYLVTEARVSDERRRRRSRPVQARRSELRLSKAKNRVEIVVKNNG